MKPAMPLSPNVPPKGIRYVDLRVAIHDNGGSPFAIGYFQKQQQEQLVSSAIASSCITTCNSSSCNKNSSIVNTKKVPTHQPPPNAPYAFIPLVPKDEERHYDSNKTIDNVYNTSHTNNWYGCPSPTNYEYSPYYDPNKSSSYHFSSRVSPSPSLKSSATIITAGETLTSDATTITTAASPSPLESRCASPSWTRLNSPQFVSPSNFYSNRNSINSNIGMMVPAPSVYSPSCTPPPSEFDTPSRGRNEEPKCIKCPSKNDNDNTDDTRKSKIKTELCMHYMRNKFCPFGDGCTYAHGKEELQMTKLMDLSRAGLVDIETYRTKPCLTWVTTGSCPFGKRCTNLHDPRVAGNEPSWLPHTETQGNTSTTDINVESLHQKRSQEILYGNPFGDQFSLTIDSFEQLYNVVCNIRANSISGSVNNFGRNGGSNTNNASNNNQYLQFQYYQPKPVRFRAGFGNSQNNKVYAVPTPIQKLDIALKMRGTSSQWQYKYRPQHIIYDEYCMVLQKRAFQLTNHSDSSIGDEEEKAVEIPLSSCHLHKNVVIVREIAFGPDSDPNVRGVALWFNISEEDVTMVTPKEAKRYRIGRNNKNNNSSNNSNNINSNNDKEREKSKFDFLDCFMMCRPCDPDAYELVAEMLHHRYQVLQAEKLSVIKTRFERLRDLEKEKKTSLKSCFENQRRKWLLWAWPIDAGRKNVDNNTPVPPVNGYYFLDTSKMCPNTKSSDHSNRSTTSNSNTNLFLSDERDDDSTSDLDRLGSFVQPIWESFVSYEWTNNDIDNSDENGSVRSMNCSEQSNSTYQGGGRKEMTSFKNNNKRDYKNERITSDDTNKENWSLNNNNTRDSISVYTCNNIQNKNINGRLPIFERLANGEEICSDRELPHILKSKICCSSNDNAWHCNMSERSIQLHRQSEQCWRSLLLKPSSSPHHKCNEWDIVFDHFEKARSKKTLKLIQQ